MANLSQNTNKEMPKLTKKRKSKQRDKKDLAYQWFTICPYKILPVYNIRYIPQVQPLVSSREKSFLLSKIVDKNDKIKLDLHIINNDLANQSKSCRLRLMSDDLSLPKYQKKYPKLSLVLSKIVDRFLKYAVNTYPFGYEPCVTSLLVLVSCPNHMGILPNQTHHADFTFNFEESATSYSCLIALQENTAISFCHPDCQSAGKDLRIDIPARSLLMWPGVVFHGGIGSTNERNIRIFFKICRKSTRTKLLKNIEVLDIFSKDCKCFD